MGIVSLIFWGVLFVTVLQTGVQLYAAFHAPRCPEGSTDCYSPLFESGELVDVYFYLTTKRKIRWWTEKGFEELQRTPFWNVTGLPFGEDSSPNETVVVPLSAGPLADVRRNESQLYAHSFMVRAGTRLEEAVRTAPGSRAPDPGPAGGVLSESVVHAAGPLTKLLPYKRWMERTNLLAEVNASATVDPDAPIRREAVFVDGLPFVGSVSLYPNEAMMWVGGAWVLGAFFEPTLAAAVVRLVLTLAMPYVYVLQQTQEAQYRTALQLRARADHDRQLAEGAELLVPHLVPQVRLELGADSEHYDAKVKPPLLFKEMIYKGKEMMPVGERDHHYKVVGKRYVPPLTVETFGVRTRSWMKLDSNASRPDPSIDVSVSVVSMHRYSIVMMLKQSLGMYTRAGARESDFEDLKDFFFRYPLHIMIIMQVIGVLQTILTTLAFKNDISFFRGRTDYTGLSSRSLATDTLQELIIFLYLYDFEDIGRIILFQVGTSTLIGMWKYARVARLQMTWSYVLPWISSSRSGSANEQDAATEEIDARGMRYLKFVMYPLNAAWGVYNLYNFTYKSWWSWFISSMADFAYTFGFINMMPQIFINYKLKSVAHMPWRVLMYKFFHTFIDDVFAFFIMADHMTKKHRWMTLRDDIVFFVFLYQLYAYRVDHARPDEYGYVYSDAPQKELEGAGAAAKEAIAAGEQPPAANDAEEASSSDERPSGSPVSTERDHEGEEVMSEKADVAKEGGADAGTARRRRKPQGQERAVDGPASAGGDGDGDAAKEEPSSRKLAKDE